MNLPAHFPSRPSWTPWTVLLLALWAQVFHTASYGWLYGEYYDFGWYVPPLALWFFYRRWRTWPVLARKPLAGWTVAVGLVALCLALAPLRTLLRTDPSWTTPLWGQVFVVGVVTFYAVWRMAGKSALSGLIPVVLFALTAVPMLGSVELILVNTLTQWVLVASSWVFQLVGKPVVVLGNQLELAGQVVAVAEGCSGIRSAQSLLMAALCIGEWLRLDVKLRVALVAAGLLAAWVTNVARACALAEIRFNQGESAFERAHDPLGMAAFVVGTMFLLGLALLMDSKRRGGQVVKKYVAVPTV